MNDFMSDSSRTMKKILMGEFSDEMVSNFNPDIEYGCNYILIEANFYKSYKLFIKNREKTERIEKLQLFS